MPERAGGPLTEQELANLLRDADFALEHVQAALVAFVPRESARAVTRDFDRCTEARQAIKAALEHMPPALPLTPEQEAEAMAVIGRALRNLE